jgi:hypothetical protein
MPVLFDTSGNTNANTSGTSTVVDITSAAVGAWCYALISVGATTSNVITTNASWTRLGALHIPGNTSSEVGLYRRQKQIGDTTFTFNYTSTFKNIVVWASYLGLDPVTPDDGVGSWLTHDTVSASYVTPSVSNTFTNGWAVAFYHVRSSSALRTMTSDAALVERQDVACATSIWFGASIDDSNSAVTTGAHSYTATASGTDAGGGAFLIYLNPLVTVQADPAVPFMPVPPGLYGPLDSRPVIWMGDVAYVPPVHIVLADQPQETDLAQAVAVVKAPWTVTVNQVVETDLAQPVTAVDGPAWTVTLGQPAETELAQPVVVVKAPWTVVLGQPAETETASFRQPVGSIDGGIAADPTSQLWFQAPGLFTGPGSSPVAWPGDDRASLAVDHTVTVNQAAETDVAQPVAAVATPWIVTVGQATETDLAQPVAAINTHVVVIGQPVETELAQPITAIKDQVVVVGQAVSTEVAQPVGSIDGGQAADPTTALAFIAPGLYGAPGSVGTVWTGDPVQPIADHLVAVNQAVETDLAQPVQAIHPWTVIVGQTVEIDLAQSMAVIHAETVIVGQAFEVDLALPVTRPALFAPSQLSSASNGLNVSTGSGRSGLSSGSNAPGHDESQSTDMMSSGDEAAGGLHGV